VKLSRHALRSSPDRRGLRCPITPPYNRPAHSIDQGIGISGEQVLPSVAEQWWYVVEPDAHLRRILRGQEQQLDLRGLRVRRERYCAGGVRLMFNGGPLHPGPRTIDLSKTDWSEHGSRGLECVRDVVAGTLRISSTGLRCRFPRNPPRELRNTNKMDQCAPSNISKDESASKRVPFSSQTANSADQAGSAGAKRQGQSNWQKRRAVNMEPGPGVPLERS
jgi:hypothetical protein